MPQEGAATPVAWARHWEALFEGALTAAIDRVYHTVKQRYQVKTSKRETTYDNGYDLDGSSGSGEQGVVVVTIGRGGG